MNANLFAALRAAFPADLARPAITTDDGLVYSWADLDHGSARFANLLGSLGLPDGSRIAVQVEKSVEAALLYLGILRAGHVILPLNTAYQSAEIGYFIGDAQPAIVVCAPGNAAWVGAIAAAAGTRHLFTLGDDRTGTLIDAAAAHSNQHECAPRNADEMAAILYTSGTTGRSKGAMLSHGNLLSNAAVLKDYWRFTGNDVLIHALPIFHVHGLFVALHAAWLSGSPMIWFNRFDPAGVIARLPQATVFMGVPTMYVRMLAEPALTADAARTMRLFISGSAPLLSETFSDWQQRTGHTILERYGMTETAMLTSNPCDPALGERRAGTVGFPLPGVGVRVCDEADAPVPAAEIGGIQVRGPNVFGGYWQMPEKTAEEFTADGWFRTGDVGKIDEDGYVTIVGRSKDLIISGGYNVYPAEIESYLNDMPSVAESAVIGVPHVDFGEVGVAVVIVRAGAVFDPVAALASLKAEMANFKVPKQCFVLDELPRNAMGKVQKAALREQFKDLFARIQSGN